MRSYLYVGIAAVAVLIAVTALPSAYADFDLSDGVLWGEATQDFATSEPGALGDHASDPGDVDPTQPGREGLGNLAKAFESWFCLLDFLAFVAGGGNPADFVCG